MIRNGYYIASDACGRDKNGKFVCVCGKCRVITNADYIRSMTDEELAAMLWNVRHAEIFYKHRGISGNPDPDVNQILKYLKEEATDDP